MDHFLLLALVCVPSRPSSATLRPLSISSTNLVTMTNKNRKRGCPLNYLHYFVGEEVEKLLQDRAVLNIEFYFHRPILRFLKEYIGYEERLT